MFLVLNATITDLNYGLYIFIQSLNRYMHNAHKQVLGVI